MPDTKVSAATELTAPQNLANLYAPFFKSDGSPSDARMNMAEVLKSATQVVINTGTLAGSSAPALSITQTWNNAATTFTGALINVTDTASNAASKLLDLQVSGTSRMSLTKDGYLKLSNSGVEASYLISNSGVYLRWSGTPVLAMGASDDAVLARDAADILAFRRSTNAELVRVYETYTDSTTFSRGVFGFRDAASGGTGTGSVSTGVLRIGTEKGSVGGTAAAISIVTNGTERIGIDTSGTATFLSSAFPVVDVRRSSTASNAFVTAMRLSAVTSVDMTDGFGSAFMFLLRDNAGVDNNVADFAAVRDGADNSAALVFRPYSGGTATERMRISASGAVSFSEGGNLVFGTTTGTKIGTATGQKIGFWNATPVVQQVLATGAGATVDNVITLLQTLGLCKQS